MISAEIAQRPEPLGLDFHTYLAAAQVGIQHGWSHIYDQQLVAVTQRNLVAREHVQPFLSPPPVAWLAAPLVPLPYWLAFAVWVTATSTLLIAAFVRSGVTRGPATSFAAILAVVPVWVQIAERVGQVVPLVAAGVVMAWYFLRKDRQTAAGLALALILLKPNTAFLIPFVLLASGRRQTFVTWLAGTVATAAAVFMAVGVQPLAGYVGQLLHPPPGTAALSLEAALGVTGAMAVALRLAIVSGVLMAGKRLRGSPGSAIAIGILGSLLVTPYLHLADLSLWVAAGWILWQEHPKLTVQIPLAANWLLVSPFAASRFMPSQNRWPLFELGWLSVLILAAWGFSFAKLRESVPSSLSLKSRAHRHRIRHPFTVRGAPSQSDVVPDMLPGQVPRPRVSD